ncbi:unnamed protein product, partial [Iphiclides podalirius]
MDKGTLYNYTYKLLLNSFTISDATATYQCRFIRTNTFIKNRTANRIVVSEFGTKAVPDPCHTIFDRVAAIFKPNEKLSDNTMVSVYPFGDEVYTFTESPIIHRIDPKTLDTLDRKDLTKSIAIVNHSAHPHVLPNGDVINIGLTVTRSGIRHVIVKFPYTKNGDMFEKACIVGSMPPRWKLHPSYMHSFGVTENYFVLIEQPMAISVCEVARNIIMNKAFASSLNWFPEYETNIVLISRSTGSVVKRFRTGTLFYFHIINAFEQDKKLIVDLCAYKDAKILNGMYVKVMESVQSNAEYAEWFRGRPKRLEVPLDDDTTDLIVPRLLVDIGCETPRINYDSYNGRPYRYFYAIGSEVDAKNPGAIIKVDTWTGDAKQWFEIDCYASEPVFVPEPNASIEDAGVLLCAIVWGSIECTIGLLVLDARTLNEIGRVVFQTPSPSPKCLHGWFLPERV